MTLQELGTVMEQQAPVKLVLMNNNYLGNVRQWQAMFFNKRYSFTPMMNPDYMQIAAAYGIPGRWKKASARCWIPTGLSCWKYVW